MVEAVERAELDREAGGGETGTGNELETSGHPSGSSLEAEEAEGASPA
jgi:hypothetical protein